MNPASVTRGDVVTNSKAFKQECIRALQRGKFKVTFNPWCRFVCVSTTMDTATFEVEDKDGRFTLKFTDKVWNDLALTKVPHADMFSVNTAFDVQATPEGGDAETIELTTTHQCHYQGIREGKARLAIADTQPVMHFELALDAEEWDKLSPIVSEPEDQALARQMRDF